MSLLLNELSFMLKEFAYSSIYVYKYIYNYIYIRLHTHIQIHPFIVVVG